MNDTAHILATYVERELELQAVPDSRDINRRLADGAESLRRIMERASLRQFEARIYDLVKTRVNLEVYVTNRDGLVLFDSEGFRTGEDFSERNDVYLTLRNSYGARSSRRVESDPQTGALYVAAPVRFGREIVGVLTVVKPKDSITPFIALARQRSLTAALLTASAIFLFAGLIFLWVTLPVRKLSRYVAQLREGGRPALPKLGKTEIGELGRALEELRNELEGKSYVERYVQALNHEIKSPLTALRGSVELLEADLSPVRRARLIENIQQETVRIQEMIERMLDLSSVENRASIDAVPVDLREVLEKQIAEQSQPDRFRIVDSAVASDSGLALVQGDAFLLGRAISNLLRNAMDFADPGTIIECSLESREGDFGATVEPSRREYLLEIRNRGMPIPDYALNRIFERFYSLPRPHSDRKSTGLGLSFVKEVMELHGGRLEVFNDGNGFAVTARLVLSG